MQNKAKKILALVMTMCLLVGLLPVSALAAQSDSGVTFVAQQLSLGDDLDMHYHVAIDNTYTQTAKMNITVGSGNASSYNISEMTPNEDGNYVFTVSLAAAQMADDITLSVVNDKTELVSRTYSVKQYADFILQGNYDISIKKIVREMLNYGTAAQEYFGHNTDNPANAGNEITTTAVIPSESLDITVEGRVSGVGFHGASLVYTSKVAVRFYFNADNVNGITFKVGDTSYNPQEKSAGLYYVEISGINPQQYNDIIELVVSNGTDSLTVGYSPMHYITRMYSKDTTSDEMKDLLTAMYSYYLAAVAYTEGEQTTHNEFYVASQTDNIQAYPNTGEVIYPTDAVTSGSTIFFAADDAGSYANEWTLTGKITKSDRFDDLILAFAVKDSAGKTQWIRIYQHGVLLGLSESDTMIWDNNPNYVFNQATCSLHWEEDGCVNTTYKLILDQDVLYGYFGNDNNAMKLSWTFSLTDSLFGGFAAGSDYQLGVYVSAPWLVTMTNVSAVAEAPTAPFYAVDVSRADVHAFSQAGKVTYPGTTDATLFETTLDFAADKEGSFSDEWTITGNYNKHDRWTDLILAFSVEDSNGKEQWFRVSDNGYVRMGLADDATLITDSSGYLVFNQALCSLYWEEANIEKTQFKLVIENDILYGYFGNNANAMKLSWSIPLTNATFGGFAAGSEYRLGIYTKTTWSQSLTDLSVVAEAPAAPFYAVDVSRADVYAFSQTGKVTYPGTTDATLFETTLDFAADKEGSFSDEWTVTGTYKKHDRWTKLILAFSVEDSNGKEQWFQVSDNGYVRMGLADDATLITDTSGYLVFNQALCSLYWGEANTEQTQFKLVVANDMLYGYFGNSANAMKLSWSIPLTNATFGGFAAGSEYRLGIYTKTTWSQGLLDMNVSDSVDDSSFRVASAPSDIEINQSAGTVVYPTDSSTDGSTIFFDANVNDGYANKWELNGTFTKSNRYDDLVLAFGVKDSAGKVQWYRIYQHGILLGLADTDTFIDDSNANYVFNQATCSLHWKEDGCVNTTYKLRIENDILYAAFGNDKNAMNDSWSFPLTDNSFGGFAAGSAYQLGIYMADPWYASMSGVSASAEQVAVAVQPEQGEPDTYFDLRLRDPYILVDDGLYYLYGTESFGSFKVYSSENLSLWKDEGVCFAGGDDFWGNAVGDGENTYWAPEVHKYTYNGETAYYMLATFTQNTETKDQQASAILKSSSPVGPFEPWSDGPITPAGHSCLDATLYIENGTPYLVYAHEWQCSCRNYDGTGTMDYIQLSADLKTTVGNSAEWFGANEISSFWENITNNASVTTDGPEFYTDANGQKYLLWSTHLESGNASSYAQLATKFSSIGSSVDLKADTIKLYTADGGHGMIFTDLAGNDVLILHTPNSGEAKATFYKVVLTDGGIGLSKIAED